VPTREEPGRSPACSFPGTSRGGGGTYSRGRACGRSSMIRAPIWARELSPSILSILATWLPAVRSDIESSVAIWPCPREGQEAGHGERPFTSTVSRSRPTKLVLAAGRLCSPMLACFSACAGAAGGVIGSLPATIALRRRRVASVGCVPVLLWRTSRRCSYWARPARTAPSGRKGA
jgi:hypothetical protein